jgi:hypothetical protein
MTELGRLRGSGACPERIPTYAFPTLFGSGLAYLDEQSPPGLVASNLVEPDLPNFEWLRYANLHVVTGDPHLFITAVGTSAEEQANRPYDVWCRTEVGVGPSENGAANPSARLFDERLNATAYDVRPWNRTMGTAPVVSSRRDTPYPLFVDAPALLSTAGAHCLVKNCVPRILKRSEANSVPVPMSFTSGLQDIFR